MWHECGRHWLSTRGRAKQGRMLTFWTSQGIQGCFRHLNKEMIRTEDNATDDPVDFAWNNWRKLVAQDKTVLQSSRATCKGFSSSLLNWTEAAVDGWRFCVVFHPQDLGILQSCSQQWNPLFRRVDFFSYKSEYYYYSRSYLFIISHLNYFCTNNIEGCLLYARPLLKKTKCKLPLLYFIFT